jgi:hypothetical protein
MEYRGYQIVITPVIDHDDLWDFKYEIVKPGDPSAAAIGHSISRRQTMGGHTSAASASEAGIELAKTEIDNHLAISKK